MSTPTTHIPENSWIAILRRNRSTLRALILRDIKSRFMGSAWGYIISIFWPITHIAILLIIHSAFNRIQPYGDSAAVWYSSGIVPFMAFSYTLRFIIIGLLNNTPLLGFPIVKIFDIILARILVEILSVGIVFSVIAMSLSALGHSFIPFNKNMAFVAIILAFSTGASFGILFAVLSKISPMWNIIAVLFILILWICSGIFFVPFFLPDYIVKILFFLPTTQVITIFRAAYFDGYGYEFADIRYVSILAMCTTTISLFMERALRGRLLQH